MSDATLARMEHGKYVGVREESRRDGVCTLRKRTLYGFTVVGAWRGARGSGGSGSGELGDVPARSSPDPAIQLFRPYFFVCVSNFFPPPRDSRYKLLYN